MIDQDDFDKLSKEFVKCQKAIKNDSMFAMEVCGSPTNEIVGSPPRFNYYDIRIPCEHGGLCYDLSRVDRFLARDDVIEALGV